MNDVTNLSLVATLHLLMRFSAMRRGFLVLTLIETTNVTTRKT